MTDRILIAESSGFSKVALDKLRAVGQVDLADLDRQALLARVQHANVLWVRLRNYIDTEVFDAATKLTAIATATTGLNHIDLEEAQRRGIRVISLKGETEFLKNIHATAEHTLALILALVRQLPGATHHVLSGGWDRDLFMGRELYGKTAGIVGYGRVGRMVARYLSAFGMEVQISDPRATEGSVEPGIALQSLERLLQTSDLVTLHVDLSEQTFRFFGKRQFDQMKPGAWFINTSRGELIDENSLLQSLASGKLAGAALDVISDEHRADAQHPLIQYAQLHSNLVITPHIAGCTKESREMTEDFLASQVVKYLQARTAGEFAASRG